MAIQLMCTRRTPSVQASPSGLSLESKNSQYERGGKGTRIWGERWKRLASPFLGGESGAGCCPRVQENMLLVPCVRPGRKEWKAGAATWTKKLCRSYRECGLRKRSENNTGAATTAKKHAGAAKCSLLEGKRRQYGCCCECKEYADATMLPSAAWQKGKEQNVGVVATARNMQVLPPVEP
eukprot:1141149-Pelagomonas_calceolata.AAC.3